MADNINDIITETQILGEESILEKHNIETNIPENISGKETNYSDATESLML